MGQFFSALTDRLSAIAGHSTGGPGYQSISQEQAKEMMGSGQAVILDVRERAEFDSGHIPGAVLLPVGSITQNTAAAVIPDLESTVLVYCRSGSRSRMAAAALARLGYSNIYDFGGILTWKYGVE